MDLYEMQICKCRTKKGRIKKEKRALFAFARVCNIYDYLGQINLYGVFNKFERLYEQGNAII